MFSYGTILTSEREIDFLTIQFNTLKQFINLDELEIFVSTSLPDRIFPFKANRIIYQKKAPISKFQKVQKGSLIAGIDCANRLDMLIKEAKRDWIILTHSDVAWTGNIFKLLHKLISQCPDCGIIENWRWGMTVISKEFYELSPFGFYGIPSLSVSKEDNGWLRIIPFSGPYSDRISSDLKKNVLGLDLGELLEIDCYNKGYRHILIDSNEYYRHVGEQSLYWTDNPEIEQSKIIDVEQRKTSFFNEFRGYL